MRVIISAGGTGGHIYPALSICDALKKIDPFVEILYIGTTDRMEGDIVPRHKINFYGIKARGLDRKFSLKNIKSLYYLVSSYIETRNVIKKFMPDIVIGVGGYVTAPVIMAAHSLKVKTLIHEQNSVLGLTNRFLSKYVDCVCTSFKDTKVDAKKVIYTGNPCGEYVKYKFDKKELDLTPSKKLVLIVMGSLGSQTVTNHLKNILSKFNDKKYEVLIATGNNYYESFKNMQYKNVKVVPFIDNIKKIFDKVDIMVTRAGATTISEIISYEVPSILVPSPYVTDNHQYKNAYALVENNAGILLEEDKLESSLVSTIDSLIEDSEKILSIKNNLKKMQIKNSSLSIAKIINEMVK